MKCNYSARLALAAVLVLAAGVAPGQGVAFRIEETYTDTDTPELSRFRDRLAARFPNMDIDVSAETSMVGDLRSRPKPAVPRAAIFARNQDRNAAFDDEMDGIRDLIAAELAAAGVAVLDKEEIAAGYRRFKVTTQEERNGLIDGLFTGGSALRLAQAIQADCVVLVSLIHADKRQRKLAGGDEAVTYRTTFSVKAIDGQTGASFYGDVVKQAYPVTGGVQANDMVYYRDLFERCAASIAAGAGVGIAKWSPAKADREEKAAFTVSTTIDELVDGLASGARGPNSLLDEVRHVVGGCTVELDGVAVGSSPGTFRTTPGLHQLRVSRAWMKPWQRTVRIDDGAGFSVALELSDAGLQKYRSMEQFKAALALLYAESAYRKGIKINFDTSAWQQIAIDQGKQTNLNNQEIHN